MVRAVNRLSALTVSRAKRVGMYPDGGGLYLQVRSAAARSWVFRYKRGGRPRMMGLGPENDMSLADARVAASDCRKLLRDGADPIEARRARRAAALLEAAKAMTFADCAKAYISTHRAGWRNPKHIAQWESTLETYVRPVFGGVPVQHVDVGLVTKVLEPIWITKAETAARLRGRIEAILDWATARGHRQGENPARWKGHLENLLPRQSRSRRIKHHPALAYADMPAFMARLRQQEGVAARALEFTILTAARTSEAVGARWSEVDEHEAVWIVPADRMKGRKEHRVPLSRPTVEILAKQREQGNDGFIFPGRRNRLPLSDMAMLVLLARMGRGDITVHGFRSAFRDWAAECTGYPREVAEMALAHAIGDKVEAAYRRGDLFEKRRRLMADWARFCAGSGSGKATGKVVTMRQAGE